MFWEKYECPNPKYILLNKIFYYSHELSSGFGLLEKNRVSWAIRIATIKNDGFLIGHHYFKDQLVVDSKTFISYNIPLELQAKLLLLGL